jgi:hypothetical protein
MVPGRHDSGKARSTILKAGAAFGKRSCSSKRTGHFRVATEGEDASLHQAKQCTLFDLMHEQGDGEKCPFRFKERRSGACRRFIETPAYDNFPISSGFLSIK